jgi:hypothetical protein
MPGSGPLGEMPLPPLLLHCSSGLYSNYRGDLADDWTALRIDGKFSRLSRYSHVRMEVKRRALDEIAAR